MSTRYHQIERRAVIAAGLASFGSFSHWNAIAQNTNTLNLKKLAESKGLLFGGAVDYQAFFRDENYRNLILENFNIWVPENALKWNRVQKTEGAPLDFTQALEMFNFFSQREIKMRGHTLVWGNAIPTWLKEQYRTQSASWLEKTMAKHVREMVTAWRGRVVHWDVVNEPVANGSWDLPWRQVLGEQYIDIAFKTARQADPDCLLVLNQDMVERDDSYDQKMRTGLLRMLEGLARRAAPIDAIGIEGHLRGEKNWNFRPYALMLKEIQQMGFKMIVTELDVWDAELPSDAVQRDHYVAAQVKDFLDTSFQFRNCIGLLCWSTSDRYTWLQNTPNKKRRDGMSSRGGVFDDSFRIKGVTRAIAQSFVDASPRK